MSGFSGVFKVLVFQVFWGFGVFGFNLGVVGGTKGRKELGLGCRAEGLGFRAEGSGFRARGSRDLRKKRANPKP